MHRKPFRGKLLLTRYETGVFLVADPSGSS
jgi:hypothetical protein